MFVKVTDFPSMPVKKLVTKSTQFLNWSDLAFVHKYTFFSAALQTQAWFVKFCTYTCEMVLTVFVTCSMWAGTAGCSSKYINIGSKMLVMV
jgi:hypothetical protein